MDGIDLEGALCAATAQHDRETTCHVGSPSEQRTVYRRSVAESGSFGLPRRGSATIAGANVSEATNAPTKASSTVIAIGERSEEHTSELQSLMRISYAVLCLKKTKLQA